MNVLIVYAVASCFVAQADKVSLSHLLSGTGQNAIDQAQSTIKAEDLYSTFPGCSSSCGHENPCVSYGKVESEEGLCSPASVYTDAISSPSQQVKYCPGERACCFPELCRRPVRHCTFSFDAYRSAIEDDLDIAQLSLFSRLATDDLVESMHKELRPSAALNTECTRNCNGWTQGIGDISLNECPSQCQCTKVAGVPIVYSGEYLCKNTQTVDGVEVVTYNIGDASLVGTLRTDTRVVCRAGDDCMHAERCMSNSDFQNALKDEGGVDNQNPTQTENAAADASSTTGLSDTSIVLIVVGSVAGVVVLVLAIIAVRKKRMANQDAAAADAGDTSDVYQAM